MPNQDMITIGLRIGKKKLPDVQAVAGSTVAEVIRRAKLDPNSVAVRRVKNGPPMKKSTIVYDGEVLHVS